MPIFLDAVFSSGAIWTVGQLLEYAKSEYIDDGIIIQRQEVWDSKKSSLLIHSLIINIEPPEFLFSRVADKGVTKYLVIDGKQRYNAIKNYVNNKYALDGVPLIEDSDGVKYDINGKRFRELIPEIQSKIVGRGLKITIVENADENIIREYFYRRNNGSPLSYLHNAIVKSVSVNKIFELSQHPFFNWLTKSNTDDNLRVVLRSYTLTNNVPVEIFKKNVDQINDIEISETEYKKIVATYDKFVEILEEISRVSNNKFVSKNDYLKRITLKRITFRRNINAMIYVVYYMVEANIPTNDCVDWFVYFFGDPSAKSISEEYNRIEETHGEERRRDHEASMVKKGKIMRDNLCAYLKKKEQIKL